MESSKELGKKVCKKSSKELGNLYAKKEHEIRQENMEKSSKELGKRARKNVARH